MGSRSHCFILRFRSICFEMNRLVACHSSALSTFSGLLFIDRLASLCIGSSLMTSGSVSRPEIVQVWLQPDQRTVEPYSLAAGQR